MFYLHSVCFYLAAKRVVTASCPLSSNSDQWLDDHYGDGRRSRIWRATSDEDAFDH
jgi:hypothetical protein